MTKNAVSNKPTYEALEARVRELENALAGRRAAEAALRESEDKYRSLFNQSVVGIYLHDLDGRFLDVNQAGCEQTGYSKSELLQLTVFDLHPTTPGPNQNLPKTEILRHWRQWRPGERTRLEAEHKRKDGTVFPVEISTGAVRYGDRALILAITQDITERRQAKEEFSRIFSMSLDMICIADIDTTAFVKVNPAFTDTLGFSEEELLNMSFLDLIHPDDVEATRRVVEEKLRKGTKVVNFENRYRCRDGGYRWLSWVSHPIPKKGKTYAVARDITDQKAAAEAIEAQNRLMSTLLDNLQVGVFMVEAPSGKPLLANKKAIDLLGRGIMNGADKTTLAEAYQAFKLGTGELYPVNELPITQGLKGRSHRVDDMVVVQPDGKKVLLEVFGSPVRNRRGDIVASIVSFSDITERKRAEAEREKLQAHLTQAKKMEAIGVLAGGIAHNFNNILMGVQGRTSLMLMNKAPSDPDHEHLRGIEEYVRNAVELTKDLLGFARGGKYQVKPTDLNTLVEKSVRAFGSAKKEIQIHVKLEKDPWPAEVDKGQIRQALLNLYVNAWQAMPGAYIKVSVTDTGVGMDAATREKIFEPFFSTKETGLGYGLGLASVYGIVKNHGGFINVYSEKGRGTTFTIYLPASERAPVEDRPAPKQDIQHGQGTILLVDDESMITEVGQAMLETLGYRVLIARNGREALHLYEKQKAEIDLVILDMIMSGMGGSETYDRLKEIDDGVKVILSSGYSLDGQTKEIMDRGCDGFIQKPFTMETISLKVREAMRRPPR